MRIAQMVLSKYEIAKFEVSENLENTTRNINGFGSTGLQ